MFTKHPLSDAVQRAVWGVAIATAAGLPALAQAQQQQRDEPLEEITVTGSRIAQDPNLITSSPVTQVNADEFVRRGITRVEDLTNDLPQVTPELSANESNGATGTATLDLRGLGSDRTLVLINGHRMGFGDVFALAPDINQIPGALVQRVEVLTGGASSTYGSDAVSGVVNFIMRDDFEGFQIDYQFSGYQHKNDNRAVQQQIDAMGFQQAPSSPRDGSGINVNVLVGINTPDGRGNVTGYLGYRDINAITHSERDFSACALDSNDGVSCGGSATIPTGLFTPFSGGLYYTVEGDQFVPWDGTYYNYGPVNYFQRPDERYTGGVFGHYQIAEQFEGYAEFMFMDNRSLAQIAPSGAFFVTNEIKCSNAFLSEQQFATMGCTSPDDVIPWYIGRRNVEGGPRFDDLRHTSFRSLVGGRGDISDNWSYDVSANFTRLIYSEDYNNDMSITRIVRALDAVTDPATGAPTCASVLDGVDPLCVPWNVFQTGGATQEAIDYLTLPLFSKGNLNQDQFVAFVSGDLTDMGLASPWASAGVELVLGAEYRDELFEFKPDQGFQSGDGAGQGGPIAAVNGSQNVTEFFTELKVPIAQDQPGFQELYLDLRYRYSDYSTGVDADTWNVGGAWTPVEGFKLRGGVSRAVRAANIRELFEPQNLGLWGGTDPCGGAAPEHSLEQCVNSGVTAAQYGSIPLSPAGQYNAQFGGNPDLQPEKADSITVGAVFTPDEYIPGLSLSIDYWRIEVDDAIDVIEPEFIVRQCNETGDPALCELVTRGPNGNLWIGSNAFVTSTQVNIGFFEAAGYDVNADYTLEIGDLGSLDFGYRATWLDKFDQQPVPGAAVEECAGTWGGSCGRPRPEYKHILNTVWNTPWDTTAVVGWRYVGEVEQFPENQFKAKGEHYLDLSLSYYPEWFGADNPTSINLGVSNALDNDPPVSGFFNTVSVYGNGNTIPATWDALGRYYFVGFQQGF